MGASSPFAADIAGNPTATSVVYDGDSNEDLFNGLQTYDGSNYWGQIVLHNTTRGNSRKIVSVDRGTNTITTTSSTDDWADNDVLTTQSTTNVSAGYVDLDLSAQIASTDIGAIFSCILADQSSTGASRTTLLHPFETYDSGKKQGIFPALADQRIDMPIPLAIVSQKITCDMDGAHGNSLLAIQVVGTYEYADT